MTQLISVIFLVVYFGGVWKFWKGFNRTNFSRGLANKLRLSALWPVLLFMDKSYRKNFQKALKG
jgi:hypothetical protein